MKHLLMLLLLTTLLFCFSCGDDDDDDSGGSESDDDQTDDDDNDTADDDDAAEPVGPLPPGMVPYVMSGDLPVPTYRYADETVLENLDGAWLFQKDPDDEGQEEGWYETEFDRSEWSHINVPGSYTAEIEDLLDYEGVAWYALTFSYNQELEPALLKIGASFLLTEVYLNGVHLGSHRGGYTPIHLPTADALHMGDNTLVVRVDNNITRQTIPARVPIQGDAHGWWPYGGITRSVTLHSLPDPWVFKIEPILHDYEGDNLEIILGLLVTEGSGKKTITAEVLTPTEETLTGQWTIDTEGAGLRFYNLTMDVKNPLTWSREFPENLYTLHVELKESGDAATVRFGMRTIKTDGTSILLNGKEDFWWGINRHSDYPDYGSVETEHTIEREVDLIQDLHANHVRPGHYPVDPRMLDALCDAGITIMEEIPQYQLFGPQQRNEWLIEQAMLQLGEMIERDKNNPAILTWSVGNEFSNYFPSAKVLIGTLADEARRLDSTRPVAAVIANVSCVVPIDFALPYVDIIGLNQYYGWYMSTVDRAGKCFDTIHRMYPEKPMIASEFGCGAVYGNHLEGTPGNEPNDDHSYTEEWQVWFHQQQFAQILERDFMSGSMPWVLADFRMQWDPSTGNPHPVSGMNLKGLSTHDRANKKMAFDTVAEIYEAGQAE